MSGRLPSGARTWPLDSHWPTLALPGERKKKDRGRTATVPLVVPAPAPVGVSGVELLAV